MTGHDMAPDRTASVVPTFSLLGGPLHRLGCRLGLVRGDSNTVLIGVALGSAVWAVLIVLALADGLAHQIATLSVAGAHVRLLVAIPLFFLCESLVDRHMGRFVDGLVRGGVVPPAALPELKARVAATERWRNTWLPEAAFLLVAVLLTLFAPRLYLTGAAVRVGDATGMSATWYWLVGMTLFRFLVLRWLWRLVLWAFFLWRLARIRLHLVPTHPDGAAGLGYLEIVLRQFAPLVLAISAVEAASIAQLVSTGGMAFGAIYPTLGITLLFDVVVLLGPACVFFGQLDACAARGHADYMEFAAGYVNQFAAKWLRPNPTADEPLLGTPDLQSLADLSNSLANVRNMRRIPLSLGLAQYLGISALLPFVPLIFLTATFELLATTFFKGLVGL